MLYVPCNHLVVCVECETDMAARPMDCSYYQEPIDEARSKRGHHDGCGVIEGKSERGRYKIFEKFFSEKSKRYQK